MARVRTVDFLPEIFQTNANRQFLAATLDTLVQEPKYKKTQGFIGRTIGPGVVPNDKYVVEPTKVRADYQLEPGVISLDPDNTNSILDAITYPGILDAIGTKGGIQSRPDRLMESDYYTWDSFCDFDALVNFSQYYWLPNGPDPVDVSATGIPISDTFDVTRANGVYTFSGVAGNNPSMELVRGGSYVFNIFQNSKETVNFKVSNQGTTGYTIDNQLSPTLTLLRGNTYVFNLVLRGPFPFWIKTQEALGTSYAYNEGVVRNGSLTGLVTFVVPNDAPDTLYYVAENQTNLRGQINIIDGEAGTGPGFWIQTSPGITGRVPESPNLSNREIVGVLNNGEDLGAIIFNVPTATQQQYFYDLPVFSLPVDLVTDLTINDMQGLSVSSFTMTYGGIDGITNLDNRTVIFTGSDPGIEPPDTRQLYQITYVFVDELPYLHVAKLSDIPNQCKWTIRYGVVYANTQWYKTPQGTFKRIPALTAALDTLYYQDGTDPGIVGTITLVDPVAAATIFIDDILDTPNYVSPNGVTFTNGLKVVFRGDTIPASYSSDNIDFVCTATTPDQNLITTYDTEILYEGQEIIFSGTTLGGLQAGIPYYVNTIVNVLQFTISATIGGNVVELEAGSGTMNSIGLNYREYYVNGVGTGIQLLPVTDFVTPELYVQDGDDSTAGNQPGDPDYITINRGSADLNAWSRSNRWFHIDVINATSQYNETLTILPAAAKARRPIIQFRPDIRLYNMGTQGKQPVDVIDFDETDALSNIEGATSYGIYGYDFVNGTRVIFANDDDEDVRNKIWQVEFIYPDTVEPIPTQPVIHLVLASDGAALVDQSVVILNSGTALDPIPSGETITVNGQEITQGVAGYTYWYDGINWTEAQLKTGVQQTPLFNVYDNVGVSFSDPIKYPSSNFTGSKLFSYAIGDTAIADIILKFPLRYLTIANVGDIVFDNNLYTDSFVYTRDNASYEQIISAGTPREYDSRTTYQKLLGWQTAATTSLTYQQFKFIFTTVDLELDVAVDDRMDVPVIKIYINGTFLDPDNFIYNKTETRTQITLYNELAPDSVIEVLALSDQTSKLGFYQVPINLQNNPFNNNSEFFTLGTVRQHYQSICENLVTLTGPVNGANNTRDLGNIGPYGLIILQQSSPLTLAGYFLRSKKFNIFNSLVYNGREYTKYKNLLLENVTQQTINFETAAQVLDTAIENITAGRVENQPFYWSDMLPAGAVYQQTVYTISYITTDTFDTLQVYDYQSANYLGMDVYLGDQILTRDLDYTVAVDGPRIIILIPLTNGQTLTIREYSSTVGNFCPNTPTKLGLYPSYEPRIVTQTTSTGEQTMLIGHDGSATKTFGDIRDDVLLEFERRIYNNLKLDGNPVPLTVTDVLPGEFRDTGYSLDEVQNILNQDFLSWVAWNKLDYTKQTYNEDNEFTYNYSASESRIDSGYLPGAWRGINRYFYDTMQPQFTPWEMLGLSIKPTWWDLTYGEPPYTNGNFVLWDDLEAGIVRDPMGAYVVPAYVRPGLTNVIPSGSEGELLPPLQSVVSTYDAEKFEGNWSLGDGGPVQASWWTSSLYPFAVMRLLILTKPAKFFALFADRDLYRFNDDFDQYLYDERYRLNANGVVVYGNGVSKASFMNWIVDYNYQSGLDSTEEMQKDLTNLDVRLCYRMASFSDKQYIKILTEKSTPDSTNTGFLIPDNSYSLLLYKNQSFAETTYSSVMVQRVSEGFQVFGYSTLAPYFTVYTTAPTGRPETFSAGGETVSISTVFTNQTQSFPYSTTFTTMADVCEFLLGYGHWLESQGFTFDTITNGYQLTWQQMVVEFLYWAGQGWDEGVLINLNPLAQRLEITRPQAIVDSLIAQTAENIILDQNRKELPIRNLNIVRIANSLTVEPLTDQSLSFVDLTYTSYEHMIVLNNRSEFGDLLYNPTTGARQYRLTLIASNTTEWNGSVDAQGFILNRDNVAEWTGTRIYTKGEIVKYKGSYWSAAKIVQPSVLFDYNNWLQSDYEQIEQGLLPNLANKADQLRQTYDINQANLESEEDLFSFGLIGFQPRQYLAALNLDDVSQVNVYRQFLGSKGTILSAENLRSARLSKEQADYDVYENWAVQRGVYGANANRSFFELRLNRALLSANPSIIQVINPEQVSQANQSIQLGAVWRESYKLTSTDILPVTTELPTDIGLPSAGYVDLNDVDITVFDINDPASLSANINQISVGTTIWVAKVNDYDWNIYHAEPVPGTISHVCDNLDGTSLVVFTAQHKLSQGDKVIIRFFDTDVDGVYDVITVPGLDTITIAFQFVGGGRTVINGTGIGFTLKTMRVIQFSDLINLPYANQLIAGARVWVDDDGSGQSAVYEKQDIYVSNTTLYPQNLIDDTANYGSAVALANNQQAALVGSPEYDDGRGAVYTYVKDSTNTYQPISPVLDNDALLILNAEGVLAYGSSIAFGELDWAIAGAPDSIAIDSSVGAGYACAIYRDTASYTTGANPYVNWQLLTTPEDPTSNEEHFGYAVAMSTDERWMYISAPDKVNDDSTGTGEVYAYTKVMWQDQVVRAIGDDITTTYAISEVIQIDQDTQILVTLDGAEQTLGADYTLGVDFATVIFATAPDVAVAIMIQRRKVISLDPDIGPIYDLLPYFFQVALDDSNIYSFQILLNGNLLRPNMDYTFNDSTKEVTISTPLVTLDSLVARANFYWLYTTTITAPADAAQFGYSIACTTDGAQVLIGAKDTTVDGIVQAGMVYVYDRNIQRFHYGETSTIEFTSLVPITNPLAVSVKVNNTFLYPETSVVLNSPNSFTVDGDDITVLTDLVVGDFVYIGTDQFELAQSISQAVPAEFSNYGQTVDICKNNCSLYTGAPQSSLQIFKGGVVERSVNQSRLFGIITGTVQTPTVTPGNTLRVNNQDVEVTGTLQELITAINDEVPNVTASLVNGYVQLITSNLSAAPFANKLQVAPGSVGTTFDDIGFETFVLAQTIQSPYPLSYAQFGAALTISDTATELLVGAPSGSTYLVVVFDNNITEFDAGATIFFSLIPESGAVYVFDYLPATAPSVTNPDTFILGQQIGISTLEGLDRLGQSLAYVSGVLFLGAPGSTDTGQVFVWQNPTRGSAWIPLHIQPPVVDIRLLNSVFLYNLVTSATTEFLDFFNPLQGKILGAARQNIDFISTIDPAGYNAGPINVRGNTWCQNHVGETWWDITTVRFLDPAQDNIVYAAKQWGQVFPGSSVDVYQWITSPTPPSTYTGPGTPHNALSYSINTVLTDQGTFQTQYFFWVRGLTTIATNKNKTLSIATVSRYIENPRLSGIAYLAPINSSTVAIYNCETLLEAQDTVLHIEFDRQLTNDNVHVEYELIPQGRADGFLTDNLYRKLLDSFCGVDSTGNLVPDANLSPAERYGVQFRPRQSMFIDRFAALKSYIIRANEVLARYPISEMRSFTLLNSEEPTPSSMTYIDDEIVLAGAFLIGNTYTINSVGTTNFIAIGATDNTIGVVFVATGVGTGTGTAFSNTVWNETVATDEILSFQNIDAVPLGYKYLVLTDSSQFGLWGIYEVTIGDSSDRELELIRVQTYRTSDYWSYIDWYRPGYNRSTRPVLEVPNYAILATSTVPVGSSVKVTANAQGKFEIYLRTATTWERVGLQDGTIEISAEIYDYLLGRFGWDSEVFDAQYFDQDPTTETRKILQALNEEIFINELLIDRNNLLVLTFNFVLFEFKAPEWLVKTSLIDVDHRVRGLLPFPNYLRDNQEFVIDYLQEVKPYHVQVREFNLRYDGQDEYLGDATDFDVPAYYNTDLTVPQYTSPILLPYQQSEATGSASNIINNMAADDPIWTKWPWNQWYGNYLMLIDSIDTISGGTGYTEPPEITIQGDAVLPTLAVATIQDGAVTGIEVIRQGSGYRDQPVVVFSGGNGTGATAYIRLIGQGTGKNYNSSELPDQDITYNLTRSFKVNLKFDRYQYQTQVQTWDPDGTYETGTLVRYDNRVWEATPSDDSAAVVGPTFDLENWTTVPASALSGVDRTMGFYVAGVNAPGLELPLLVDGISYPGVQVWGNYFSGTAQLDADYQSSFADVFLGTRPTDINLDGGQFIGPYEGHAPEELINGAEFDTLDMRVYTRPGSDWQRDGHGFHLASVVFDYTPTQDSGSWGNMLGFSCEILVSNQTTDRDLALDIDYEVDWLNETVIIIPSANVTYGDAIQMSVYSCGGGSQLYQTQYFGNELPNNSFIIPVNSAEITGILLVINGQATDEYDWEPYIASQEWDQLQSYVINTVVNDSGSTGPNYYRSLQSVPIGITLENTEYWLEFTPTLQSRVYIDAAYDDNDKLCAVVLGTNTVPAGEFIRGRSYTISFVGTTDWVAIGATIGEIGETFTATEQGGGSGQATTIYSWSIPQVQYQIADTTVVSNYGFPLTNSLQGTNVVNMIVTRNGRRLTPPAGIQWIGDGTTNSFGLPQRMGSSFLQSSINAITDIQVWVDDILQVQGSGPNPGDYGVTNWDGSNTPGRQVVFNYTPVDGAQILITLSTLAAYSMVLSNIQFVVQPNIDDIYAVTTWNDTSQQDIVTECFYGPVVTGVTVSEGFDSTNFDPDFVTTSVNGTVPAGTFLIGDTYTILTVGTTDFVAIGAASNTIGVVFVATGVGAGTGTATGPIYSRSNSTNSFNDTPGTFDYSAGTEVRSNDFDLSRVVPANRLWVVLNGDRLFEGEDFYMVGSTLILSSGTIGLDEILAVTIFTNNLVPGEAAFRIFQDMRGVQATYNITQSGTTSLVVPLSMVDDVIYVQNAAALTQPILENGVFGVLTIGGERITYRERDIANNTVSGLRRGTAGTAGSPHNIGDAVYNMGRNNLLAQEYQDYIVSDTSTGDGSTNVFYAPNIVPDDFGDSFSIWAESIEVYVGGQRQYPTSVVPAGKFQIGNTYTIYITGDTNFVAIGAASNTIGTVFVATGIGLGDGSATSVNWTVTDYDPVAIDFVIAPPEGVEVTILQRRGKWWYDVSTATARAQALQENDSIAARFLTDRLTG